MRAMNRGHGSVTAHLSHAPWGDVAVNLSVDADENDAVTGGISCVPFQLLIRHGNFGSVRNYSFPVRDNGDVTVLVYFKEVSFVGVSLTTTRTCRVVGLH